MLRRAAGAARAIARPRALCGFVCALLLAAPAAAGAQLLVGVQDDPVFVRLPSSYSGLGTAGAIPARVGYERIAQLGAGVLRIGVDWAAVQHARPPAAESWARYDAAVASAKRAGLAVQLVLEGPAPAFATGDHRTGAFRPSARAFARFAEAAARRYRGEVSTYSIWNEPNWWSSLKPDPLAPMLYRALYATASSAIRRVDPQAQVLIGELAPIGYGGTSIAPLRFLRELSCRTRAMRSTGRCSPLIADGFALHPYTLRWPPSFPGPSSEDVTTGSLPRLVRLLAALARAGALVTPAGQAPPLYLTEYGWSPRYVRSERRRAAMAAAALRLVSSLPQVREIVWYELVPPPAGRPSLWNTALLTRRGQPTPVFDALRTWIARAAAAVAPAPGPSSTSGSAQSVRLKSPRSQSA